MSNLWAGVVFCGSPRVGQPIPWIPSPAGGAGPGWAGPPGPPKGNRAGGGTKISGENPMRGPMGHGERCRGPDGLRERGGAGEPRQGRAGAEQSREGPTAGLSHLNPWRLPAEAEGPGTAGAASVAAAAIGTGGECGALWGCGAALSPSHRPPAGRARPAPPR